MFSDGLSLHIVVFERKARLFVGAETVAGGGQLFQAAADDFQHAQGRRGGLRPKVLAEIEDDGARRQRRQWRAAGKDNGNALRKGRVGPPDFVRQKTLGRVAPQGLIEAFEFAELLRPH